MLTAVYLTALYWSRPARGAWVEILFPVSKGSQAKRRAPQGARGLKLPLDKVSALPAGRAPQGARGLKF